MSAIVACPSCGGKLRVADSNFGRKLKCPRCGGVFVAGGMSNAQEGPSGSFSGTQEQMGGDEQALPMWIWAVCGLIPLALFIVVLWFLFQSVAVIVITLFLMIFVAGTIPAFVFLRVSLAKSRAIHHHLNEVSLFGGVVKLILWEANEGLVFLKNKRVNRLIYGPKDGGGTQLVFPIFGEELKVRVPLTLKLTQFEDGKVVTRESTQLFMRVAIWWRVAHLERYYYLVDKEVHVVTDAMEIEVVGEPRSSGQKAQQHAAEAWILTLAESCIRKLVSQTTTALIISKTATSYLHVDEKHRQSAAIPTAIQGSRSRMGDADAGSQDAATPGVLADEIRAMLMPKASEYGLEIERVEIQEVRLPENIQKALDEVFKSTLLPAKTQQEALAEQIRLKSLAGVLGVETVKLQEALKQFRGSQYIGGFPRVIEAIFAKATEPVSELPAIAKSGAPTSSKALASVPASSSADVRLMCPSCGSDTVQQTGSKVECQNCGTSFRLNKKKSPS